MPEWIAPQEYTTNSTDDGQAYDEAWQAQNQITQNDTARFPLYRIKIGVF